MRNRFTKPMTFIAAAAIMTSTGTTPAMADSTAPVPVHFYNDGAYYAYADIWGYDEAGNEVYHDWSGTEGHGGERWFWVPAGVARLHWMVRLDPIGNTIHEQWINPWYDFACDNGKHATLYVGGIALVGFYNTYDMHCSYW